MGKSRKTFDIIVFTKSVFFISIWDGEAAARQPRPPLLGARLPLQKGQGSYWAGDEKSECNAPQVQVTVFQHL
jgi:hypothetical protein